MTEKLIPIELIDANPYQPRKVEDAQAVEELALDVLHHATPDFDGLMQVPTVRAVNGRYQLAFGHTRKAAFKYLVDAGQNRYEEMRANVRELSDVQMFELAVAENIKRRDLNPLEQAEALRRYMDEFGKTSKEAGEFFGMAEETVRQKVRLLNLPESVQDQVRQGKVNENAARSLLTLAKVLPNNEEALEDALMFIESGERADEAVENVLRSSPETKMIHASSFSTKAKTFKYLPKLKAEDVLKALDVENNLWVRLAFSGYGTTVEDALAYLKLHLGLGSKNGNGETLPPELIERFEHLIKPPACTACPLFAQMDGIGYCGWIACHERKTAAHMEQILHETSEKTGIAVLASDDRKYTNLSRWTDKHMKYWEKGGEDLRLKLGRSGYGSFADVPDSIGVVAVGKTHAAWKKQEEQSKQDKGGDDDVGYTQKWEIRKIKDAQMEGFVWEQAVPAFASLLEDVRGMLFLEQMLEAMDRMNSDALPESESNKNLREKMSKSARETQAKQLIVFYTLMNAAGNTFDYQDKHKETPTAALAKHLKGVATTWGVKLPKDFEAKAAEYDKAIQLELDEWKAGRK